VSGNALVWRNFWLKLIGLQSKVDNPLRNTVHKSYMVRNLAPVLALLAGSAFLLFAGGINALILPVRGSAEGFSAFSLGLLGTGWAMGFIAGCLLTPRLVARVGHIRSFSVMAACAAMAMLASLLLLSPFAWIPLRAVTGFCFAGGAMIVESWLSERADAASRGRIFGIYTMVNLGASTAGQMMLTLGDASGYLFFVLGAMFYCLALIPTAVTATQSPRPLVSVKLDIGALWRNSPVAVFGVAMIGVSNSAFGTLSAVYADRAGLALTSVALFASVPILAGAVAQVPVGALSDRMDRRKVLLMLAIVALVADAVFIMLAPEGAMLNLAVAAVFGASIYAMYPVIIAHASDHAAEGTAIQTSGGLLMIYGVGGIIGPLVAGILMSVMGKSGLFLTSVTAHALLINFTIWRIRARAPVTDEEKSTFIAMPGGRGSTPETRSLATRSDLPASLSGTRDID